MYRLSVLGRIDLRSPANEEVRAVLAQPKRLALLVYLAVSRPHRFHRRDALLALFWPERDENGARNALRQALHLLRRSLGADVEISRGADAIGIDPARLACDATQFEDALDLGLLAEALSLYRGDLVPGFSISGAEAFNAWLDQSATRLRRRAARAAWALAEQRERSGALAAAAESARRAAELTLDDEAALRQLMALLDRVGDLSGALRVYDEFATRLRGELDVEPSSETRALVVDLRARLREPVANGAPSGTGPSVSFQQQRKVTPPQSAPSVMRSRVLVSTFENHTGDAALDFVGRLAADAVAQALAETRLVEVVAVDRGAMSAATEPNGNTHMLVEGSYHLADERWRLRATLRSAADGRSIGSVAAVEARRDRPWEAAHALSERVRGTIAGHLEPRLASWAAVVAEPPSLEAHRTHLAGMELHLRGEYRRAIAHFMRAANLETGFAIPVLWAIQASLNLEEYEQAAAIHETLAGSQVPLSPAEQHARDYFGAWLAGDRGLAFRTLRSLTQLVPDSELLSQLGRDAMFFNRPRYAVEVLERLDPERGWIPSWTPYWRRLTEAYHILGDHERERDAARRGRLQHPEAVSTLLYEARAHAALGEIDAVRRATEEAVVLATDRFATAGDVLFTAAQELRAHAHEREAAAMLAQAIDWQTDASRQGQRTLAHQLMLGRMYYEAERWEESEAVLAPLRQERSADVDVLGCQGTLAARIGDKDAARSALALLRAKTGRFHFGKHLLWGARIAARLGEAGEAVSLLRGAFARGCSYGVELHSDIDLSLLEGDERYRELLRPKG